MSDKKDKGEEVGIKNAKFISENIYGIKRIYASCFLSFFWSNLLRSSSATFWLDYGKVRNKKLIFF